MIADYDEASAQRAAAVDDRFTAARVDASSAESVTALCREHAITHVMNAVDPRFVMPIFDGAYAAGADYLDMAMSLSRPHAEAPYAQCGVKLGDEQFAAAPDWESAGRLALVGIGVEPGLSDVFARYAADHLFREIDELGVRDGANLRVEGPDGEDAFAPSFSIWTTIEECLNPPVIWQDGGWFTTPPFSEPEVFDFPEGIGPVECVNVEHEEVLLMPRWVDCKRATFKYGLGDEFIDVLKTLHKLGLDRTDKVRVGGVEVSPRDVVAACLPNPAELGPRMTGKTCAGLWVTGTGKDGEPRSTYLYHVVDNEWSMRGVRPPVRGLADRDQPRGGPGAARHRGLEGLRRARAGGLRRGAVPRPAHRLREPVGDAGGGAVTGGPTLPQERRLVTEIPGPESLARLDRKKAHVADGVGTMLPVFVVAAGGGVLVDVDGNSLIDLGSGIAVVSVGNAAPSVVARVQEQVAAFTHTCFMITPYDGYVDVCAALGELTPGGHAKKTALFNSGAEAVENAVKIARAATGRDAVAVFDHAYHGRTNLTMAMTAKNMPYKDGFGPFAGEVYRAPMSYPFRDGLSGEEAAARAIDVIEKQVGATNLACVVIEPIQGEGGFVVPAPGFLPALADWCTENDVVFVADEIQTGFCRTGDWFASDDEGVVPDLVTTAKGIAGGLPLAGVTGRADLMDSVHVGGLGGTYGGNPVACAAALGAIEEMRTHDLAGRAREIGAIMRSRLTSLQEEYAVIGDLRGRGAMMAIELCAPGTTDPDPVRASAVSAYCHQHGVVTLTCGTWGNVFRFLPPLSISDDLLHEAFDVVAEAFAATA